ncbi:hypothetical protein FACS1894201_11490 [Bacteroidia bacterium]|nr:hypothetical protein FACS1894201_11490 [Bacteroidia bacterium]
MSCSSTKHSAVSSGTTLFDTTNVSKYRVLIKIGQTELSGILVVKYIDNEWRGSLMNEFGIKAFDFVAPQGKCKLQNTISFLDKGYIRKTVESDFAFLLWDVANGKPAKEKHLERSPDGSLILKNDKRNIEYSLQLIE